MYCPPCSLEIQADTEDASEWSWIDIAVVATIDLRIESLVIGDGKYVVAGQIELETLNPLAEVVECVREAQGLQTKE